MPPVAQSSGLLPVSSTPPRLVLYAQTHHTPEGNPISLLPLITQNTGVTHVILAALHINQGPGNISLNDDPPDHPKFDTLWAEVGWLLGAGVKVSIMVGGAAKGSWERLSGSEEEFNAYFEPVIDLIKRHGLSGLDLDIEEEVPLATPMRTMRRLDSVFGKDFLLTYAPTCTALLPETIKNPLLPVRPYHFDHSTPVPNGKAACTEPTLKHLSGFSYPELFGSEIGSRISWLNAQLYCGWGDASQPQWYDAIIAAGWPADKVVLGVVTTSRNGSGSVPLAKLLEVFRTLRSRHRGFGGVMGWEYFNSGENDPDMAGKNPWDWVKAIGQTIRSVVEIQPVHTPHPWREEDVLTLVELGFSRADAIQALSATENNVELAAGILFDQ
ncbi:glycoside hydrolase [Pseudovirgaria hyperparasitica]|uniref:Glycoside hydrolase n=1 Tax=Pseudovirgaria hyperparasitica TaxID=470096 RepID=A0A6A6WE16_9PEZI|nr:glycoside hydrolase [Pseudovirgaria hyperparasitica]KAF2760230.1 glycoside hydrolase [Pseudovirgaria hyperparasitica]